MIVKFLKDFNQYQIIEAITVLFKDKTNAFVEHCKSEYDFNESYDIYDIAHALFEIVFKDELKYVFTDEELEIVEEWLNAEYVL